MGKLTMDSWLGRVGLLRPRKPPPSATATTPLLDPPPPAEKLRVGVLAFEVSSLMSKLVRLWHSLSDDQIARLRDDVLPLQGVRKLVSHDDSFLLALALSETLDAFAFLARATARLGRKCSQPALRRFDHALADLLRTGADPHGLEYLGKKMERKVKKMERFVATCATLYQEMEVLAELEQGLRRVQAGAAVASQLEYRQKVVWQRQEVRSLRDASLWNRTYDYTVRLLARSLFTILARIEQVFGFHFTAGAALEPPGNGDDPGDPRLLQRCRSSATGRSQLSGPQSLAGDRSMFYSGRIANSGPLRMLGGGVHSGPLEMSRSGPLTGTTASRMISSRQCPPHRWIPLRPARNSGSKNHWPALGGPFGGCIAVGTDSPVLQGCITSEIGSRRSNVGPGRPNGGPKAAGSGTSFSNFYKDLLQALFDPQHKLLVAPPSTLGATALSPHYANVIAVIEKLAACPHLIGPDARDDLYSMLPTSIRSALRAKLKTYAKNMAAPIYDPVLAAEWSDAITKILEWLAPLAHNMIRWQSEQNYEQQRLVSGTNILLLQTLYFANQEKTEAAITELLVGLNYLWRFGRELNAKAASHNQAECISVETLMAV